MKYSGFEQFNSIVSWSKFEMLEYHAKSQRGCCLPKYISNTWYHECLKTSGGCYDSSKIKRYYRALHYWIT